MPFQIIFQNEALVDIQEAYHWYEDQLSELGENFLSELNEIVEKLKRNPQYFGYAFDNFRDARLKRFPYIVVFKISGRVVYINSVKHTKRKPRK